MASSTSRVWKAVDSSDRARDVALVDVAGQADDRAAGVARQYGANRPENAGTK